LRHSVLEKLFLYVSILRVYNLLEVPVISLTGAALSAENIPMHILTAIILVPLLSSASQTARADLHQRKEDAIAKPHHPIYLGKISVRTVQVLIRVLQLGFIVVWILTLITNLLAIIVGLLSGASARIYNVIAKKKGVWGPITRGVAECFIFLFGAVAVTNTIPLIAFFVALFFFLYGVASNIAHSVEDYHGDVKAGVKTAAVVLGPSKAVERSLQVFLAAFGVLMVIALFNLSKPTYLIIPMVSIIILFRSLKMLELDPSRRNGHWTQIITRVCRVSLCVAFIASQLPIKEAVEVVIPVAAIMLIFSELFFPDTALRKIYEGR